MKSKIEQKLIDNGFVGREIDFLKGWLEQDKYTYSKNLVNLRRLFIGFFVMKVIMTLILIYNYFSGHFISFFIPYALFMFCSEFFAPSLTGAKLFKNYKNLI